LTRDRRGGEIEFINDFFPNVRPVAAMKARVWSRPGQAGGSPYLGVVRGGRVVYLKG